MIIKLLIFLAIGIVGILLPMPIYHLIPDWVSGIYGCLLGIFALIVSGVFK